MTVSITRRDTLSGLGSVAALALLPKVAMADGHSTHEILMLNKDPNDPSKKMVFSPRILQVNPGDTVKFLVTDKGHNSESIKGMVPNGAEKWKGKMNKEVEVTLTTPGFYGYQCKPHAAMGMIGLIVVEGDGKLDNLEDAKSVKHRGKAKKAWQELWAEAEAAGLMA